MPVEGHDFGRQNNVEARLLLIGGKFQDPSPATHEYAKALRQEEAELAAVGALERIKSGNADIISVDLTAIDRAAS